LHKVDSELGHGQVVCRIYTSGQACFSRYRRLLRSVYLTGISREVSVSRTE
jgi:hypothetical protein